MENLYNDFLNDFLHGKYHTSLNLEMHAHSAWKFSLKMRINSDKYLNVKRVKIISIYMIFSEKQGRKSC